MKKLVLFAALALAACGGSSQRETLKPGQKQHVRLDPVNPKAMIDFEAAMRAFRLGGPEASETAKARLKDAVEKDKNLWEAWHNLGIIALRDGDDSEAVDDFDHALAINKDHNETLLSRAEAHRHAGDKKAARADYEAALRSSDEEDPIRRDAAARLASLLRDFGDYDDAVNVLRDTIRLSGINAKIYTELGLIYILQDRLDLAQLVLNKAVDLDEADFKAAEDGKGKRDASIYNALALLAMKQGKAQEAFQRFDQAVQLDPNYVDARFSKASVLLDAGDYERAKAELAVVVDKRPDDYAAQVSLGVAQRGMKDLPAAKKTWDKVIKEAPKKSDARADAMWNEFTLALDYQNDTASAKTALERYMQEAPSNHAKRTVAEEKRKELKL
ncbi:MAG TPA: tetratricopeptide repeat protein [Kofleriaceae bacterium]|jgi:tetratricopeptide (TPR) repeat protein